MSERLVFSACISAAVDRAVLVVTIDKPPVNAASAAMRAGLLAAVTRIAEDPDLAGGVITGAGRIFIGGADITEFGKPMIEPILPDVIAAIEACPKPIAAVLNGAALGGGLEVALGCHHRAALPSAVVALPEVKLGIVPGAGGTQRLPRLTGVAAALDLAGTGRMVKSEEALRFGIVDTVSSDALGDTIDAIAGGKLSPCRKTSAIAVPGEAPEMIEAAAAKIKARAKQQPAPLEAIRLVVASASTAFEDGLRDERQTFIRLRDSEEAAALRYVFFAEREAAKIDGLKDVAPRPVERIGVVGLGLMGSGIAVAALDAGYSVIGIETSADAADAGRARIRSLFERNLKSGRIDQAGLEQRLGRFSADTDFQALAAADLVIEAVYDDLGVKTDLFAKLAAVVRDDAVLATNTSYLDPDAIAAAATLPERVVGMHFFSPANVMRLLEVVRCGKTSPDVLATALAVGRKMGKLPVVSGVTEGFIGNSIFSAYRREAEFMVEDGAAPEDVDAAMERFGMAMGPFAVFDLAGLEIAWARRKRQAGSRDPAARYVDIADRLCEAGRFGQKTGRGWYRYVDGKRQADPEVEAIITASRAAKGITARPIAAAEIVARLVKAMAAEGRRLLDEGIAARPGDVDLVMINGYGFPAHKGGPMYQASRDAA